MKRDDWSRAWEWDIDDAFHSRYDASASQGGLSYGCEIKGPFCGYDGQGSQSWDEFLAAGPPERIHMPASIAAEIRAHFVARKSGVPRSEPKPAVVPIEPPPPIEPVAPIVVPETDAKIRMYVASNIQPAFSTVSELRDSLLASYPDAARLGGPFVGRDNDDRDPAWYWAIDLVRMRSDWWPALGIALQHAATHGGELARTALVELLAHFNASIAVLPWTAPMATRWGDRRAVNSAATGWGAPDFRLDAVVRDQQKYVAAVRSGKSEVFLDGHGVDGEAVIGPLTNEAELRALLAETARAGRFPEGTKGPWSWLAFELLIGDDWMRPALVRIASTLEAPADPMIFALLDWFSEEQDLWRFIEVLDGWIARPPPWWNAMGTPTGWQRSMRTTTWPGVQTLGDVVVEARRRARQQVLTAPVVDLPRLY